MLPPEILNENSPDLSFSAEAANILFLFSQKYVLNIFFKLFILFEDLKIINFPNSIKPTPFSSHRKPIFFARRFAAIDIKQMFYMFLQEIHAAGAIFFGDAPR